MLICLYVAMSVVRHDLISASRVFGMAPGLMVPTAFQQQQQMQSQHRRIPVTKRVLSLVNPETNKPIEIGTQRYLLPATYPSACVTVTQIANAVCTVQLQHLEGQQMVLPSGRAVLLPKKPSQHL